MLQAYQTLKGDSKRYRERLDEIASRPHRAAEQEPSTSVQPEASGEGFILEDHYNIQNSLNSLNIK